MRPLVNACLLLSCLSIPALADDYFDNLLSIIKPPHSHTAILATNLVTGDTIFQQNPDTLLLPASTMKLLTAVAATASLGSDFRFSTRVYSTLPIKGGVIAGDIYISFSGDPTLKATELRSLLKQLTDQGLYRIEGNVYLIGQANEQLQAPGWVWDDLGICYAAPVSDFVLNGNCVHGKLSPKLASNQSQLTVPGYVPISITNTSVFDKLGSEKFCQLDLQRLSGNHFSLSGCYSGSQAIKLAIAITDPGLFMQESVEQVLKSSQIQLQGKISIKHQLPTKTRLIAAHESAPLSDLVRTMLIKSDNLIADSLLKQLGQKTFQRPGNFSNGSRALKEILSSEGIVLTHAQIVDGSGLSRYNLLSARQLSQVLSLIYTDPRFAQLIDSLPVAGVSGTLKYKTSFNKPPLREHIMAKTGSMQGVDNLAGFIRSDTQDDTLFVILENGQSPLEKKQQQAPFSALFLHSLMDNPLAQHAPTDSDRSPSSQAN
ncbi:D-alanyl-D-alanine carboxypeptidase, serine-type, PBP4 family [Shewanella psychrophila]|uniref:D-alanyl-D-alanine carboxypeptidase, serine-type, PBP4 family n=1 Tax=Shewanella psychrophila TaxID=225848 RepID=A0A1S6HKG9_9GAMM|nr:D-alanyl-D-alanine carboxypeptidase/D-alanyl-D-alanine-endopeptidase [Shewanella psychrophila]AQS36017.1 D-alanyl-D-alanine carboxypeptidase, serine-type, PBP4 family [Shewanella psychrophila]